MAANGPDEVVVALEAYSRVGYGPVYLGYVSDSPRPPVRIPSPRRAQRPGKPLR